MASTVNSSEKEARILQAISTCHLTSEMTQAEKELAVTENMLLIDRMMSERSLASRVLSSVRLIATVESVEFEENSKRYKVNFIAERAEEGQTEYVRTERTDGYYGPVVEKMIAQELVGKRCMIFKETIPSSTDPMKKVRITPYIKVL